MSFQGLDSVDLGATDIDQYVESLGGVTRVIAQQRGGDTPAVYMGDYSGAQGKVRSLEEQVDAINEEVSKLKAAEQMTQVASVDKSAEDKQIKEALGDDLFLLDGIPAVYFDDTFSVDTLVECTHRLIELFAPKLVLGISDEISSTGDLERVRIVGQIVDEYNARFESDCPE